jgi:hypothetical protein
VSVEPTIWHFRGYSSDGKSLMYEPVRLDCADEVSARYRAYKLRKYWRADHVRFWRDGEQDRPFVETIGKEK